MVLISLLVGVGSLLSLGVCNELPSRDRIVFRDNLQDLPECAYECMVPVLTAMNCDFTNTTALSNCLCSDVSAERSIAGCVVLKCNPEEQYEVAASTAILCQSQPQPTRQPRLLAASITLGVAVLFFVVLRCWSRYSVSKQFWWDDWLLLLAATLLLTMHAVTIWGTTEGYGRHIWTVFPTKYKNLLIVMYIYEILYAVVQTLTKIIILLLYYRIFSQKWLQRTVIIFGIFMIIHVLAYVPAIVFLCSPVAFSYDKSLEGTCGNPAPLILSGAIASLLEDLAIILLPISPILQLQLRTSKKIGVVVIMWIGSIAVIASMVRLKYVVHFSADFDANWDYYGVTITSSIELSTAMICVCIPACKLLLNSCLPAYFGSNAGGFNRTLSLNTYVGSTQHHGSEAKLKSKTSTVGNLDEGSRSDLADVERGESSNDGHRMSLGEVGVVSTENAGTHVENNT